MIEYMPEFTETYAAVKQYQGVGLRHYARWAALSALSVPHRFIKDTKPRVQFLYIHHIFQDEELPFETMLKALSEEYAFVSYSEAVNRVLTGNIDRPYLSISSDDGFHNNLAAGRILRSMGISACFFLNPGLIGETNYHTIKQHCAEKLEFPPVAFLNWQEVEQLQKMGHEIGAHTLYHERVSSRPSGDFADDCIKSRDLLLRNCGEIKHFSFPYGRFSDFSAEAAKTVFESGFESCASAERGCHVGTTPLSVKEVCIRRDHILPEWPLSHVRYFLNRNSRRAGASDNEFPYPAS